MAVSGIFPAYEEFVDYLLDKLSPDEILAFQASESAQAYARNLLERNSAGTLTAQEQIELDQMLQLERLMSMLKARALAL